MSENAPLARLRSGDVREVWPHEARNFTPWLFENLAELGAAVGMRLEPVESEVAVESFFADILARDLKDDSFVLIENQLEGSDHSHLGQILTYLAGLEARTVIWVATEFRDSHLSAIEWLNEHTHEQFSFFAVRVRAVRIADSPYAALFDVLARPNDWDRRLHVEAAVRTGSSDLGKARLEFWTAYANAVPGERERSGEPTRSSNRWRVLTDLNLILSLYVSTTGVGIFIRAPRRGDPEEVRGRLTPYRAVLEQALETEAGWADEWGFLSKTMPGDFKDPAQRDRLIQWLAAQADHYELTLRRILSGET